MKAVPLAKITVAFLPLLVSGPIILAALPRTMSAAAFRAAFLALDSLAVLAYALTLTWPLRRRLNESPEIWAAAAPLFVIAGLVSPGAVSGSSDVPTLAVFLLVSPIAEELIFRGWMYEQAQQGRGELSLVGLAVITVLFSASHLSGDLAYLGALLALGAGLHLVRHFGKSLWLTILCHALFNAGALAS